MEDASRVLLKAKDCYLRDVIQLDVMAETGFEYHGESKLETIFEISTENELLVMGHLRKFMKNC